MTFTEIQAAVSKTAAFSGTAISVSGITGDWTLKIQVESMTAEKTARLGFEDTVNDWTASVVGPTYSFLGAIAASYDKVYSIKKKDFPNLRLGTSDAQLRCSVLSVGSGGTVKYRAWVEY